MEVIAGISAISGHIWPIWLSGKEGRLATGLGMFLALSWKVGLASLGIFLIVLAKTKFVSYQVLRLQSYFLFYVFLSRQLYTFILLYEFNCGSISYLET